MGSGERMSVPKSSFPDGFFLSLSILPHIHIEPIGRHILENHFLVGTVVAILKTELNETVKLGDWL